MNDTNGINTVIFGATGMVGIEVLHQCLDNTRIKRVVAVGRHSTVVTNQKLREIEYHDYLDYSSLESVLSEMDICFYCLGVYQGQVVAEKFIEITCDYLAHLIDSIDTTKRGITFCLFSAQGADPTEKSRMLFARAKGKAENSLLGSALDNKYIFRPGYIHPGRRRAKSRIPSWAVTPFYKLIPSIGIDASALASVMVDVGLNGSEQEILENRDIRKRAATPSPQ